MTHKNVIHYATGGMITPEESKFSTLCGRTFKEGGEEIMQSGMIGARNVTCKICKRILERIKKDVGYSV